MVMGRIISRCSTSKPLQRSIVNRISDVNIPILPTGSFSCVIQFFSYPYGCANAFYRSYDFRLQIETSRRTYRTMTRERLQMLLCRSTLNFDSLGRACRAPNCSSPAGYNITSSTDKCLVYACLCEEVAKRTFSSRSLVLIKLFTGLTCLHHTLLKLYLKIDTPFDCLGTIFFQKNFEFQLLYTTIAFFATGWLNIFTLYETALAKISYHQEIHLLKILIIRLRVVLQYVTRNGQLRRGTKRRKDIGEDNTFLFILFKLFEKEATLLFVKPNYEIYVKQFAFNFVYMIICVHCQLSMGVRGIIPSIQGYNIHPSSLHITNRNLYDAWLKKSCIIIITVQLSFVILYYNLVFKKTIQTFNLYCRGRMIPSELERLILERKSKGHIPFFVTATAGTTVLGAFDPINEIADICEKYKMWLHIDAAWGGGLLLSRKYRHPRLNGIERFESHYVNYCRFRSSEIDNITYVKITKYKQGAVWPSVRDDCFKKIIGKIHRFDHIAVLSYLQLIIIISQHSACICICYAPVIANCTINAFPEDSLSYDSICMCHWVGSACACVDLLPLISRTAAITFIQHTRCYDDTRVPATVAAPPLRERPVPPKRLIEF
ncbi:hypothetical protein QTP88_018959 [Uroleucon formosanum]